MFCDTHHVSSHNDRQLIMRALIVDIKLDIRKVDDMQLDRSGIFCHFLCKIHNFLFCTFACIRRRMEVSSLKAYSTFGYHVSCNRAVDTAG